MFKIHYCFEGKFIKSVNSVNKMETKLDPDAVTSCYTLTSLELQL